MTKKVSDSMASEWGLSDENRMVIGCLKAITR